MKRIVLALAAFFSFIAIAGAASAKVNVRIDLSTQRMYVTSSQGSYVWPVSTARSGFVTPRGSYAPQRLERMHYSRKYHMSPMPHSIFFRGGYAIHGTGAVSQLGRPASHGCIRLAPGNAARLYSLVQREGASISITGSSPARVMVAKRHFNKTYYAQRRSSNPYAYAPRHRDNSVRSWQSNPLRW
jgi:hypothetical protein